MKTIKAWLLGSKKGLFSKNYLERCLNPKFFLNFVKLVIYETRFPKAPWITVDSLNILDSYLKKNDQVIEFGSGMSTIWLATRVKRLVSIEHDPSWFERVKKDIWLNKLSSKVDYRILNGQNGEESEEYINVIDSFKNNTFDCCLVDGQFRDKCALKILDKIKKGGVLVIDNINVFIPQRVDSTVLTRRTLVQGAASKGWEKFCLKVKNWRYIWTTNGVSDTAIWFKP